MTIRIELLKVVVTFNHLNQTITRLDYHLSCIIRRLVISGIRLLQIAFALSCYEVTIWIKLLQMWLRFGLNYCKVGI